MCWRTLADSPFETLLKKTDGHIRIGCDSEFQDTLTLTTQFAVRDGNSIVVQVYRAPDVPEPSADFSLGRLREHIGPHCPELIFRPVKLIDPWLSPLRVVLDLFQLSDVEPRPRRQVESLLVNDCPSLTLTLIAHYMPADLFRLLGREFLAASLLSASPHDHRLCIESQKQLRFAEARRRRFQPPVLEFAYRGLGLLHPIRVETFDTMVPFGRCSLDQLGQAFLGCGKLDHFTEGEKQNMLGTFHTKPADAYQYAAMDAILTLLVEEQMRKADADMYRALGFRDDEIPPLRSTQGSRVVDTIIRTFARDAAAGSVQLSAKGKLLKSGEAGQVSLTKVKDLMSKGSGEELAGNKSSHFGKQIQDIHGGLLFSRSPDKYFHSAPGQFRDVDLSGCYAAILGSLNLYAV